MRNILSLLLVTSTYFGLHLAIYLSVTRFFGLTSFPARLALLLSLIALSLSFVITSLISRIAPGAATSVLYRLAADWVALLFFLAIAFAVTWAAHLILQRFGVNIAPIIGSVAVVASLAVITVGTVAAARPTVTDVTVSMKGLPPQWVGRTVIQLSDVHLGQVQGPAFAARLVEQVNALNPYVILITGDLFDGMGSNLDAFIEILNGLRAERGVFFVTGNHEHYLGIDRVLTAMQKSNFRILDSEVVDVDGLQVVGLAFPGLSGESYPNDIITSRPGYDAEKPGILMYHEPVNVNHQSDGETSKRTELYFSPNLDYTVQKESGIDLQISGHTHAGQFFPFTLVARNIYKGNHYGLHVDGDFSLYVTSGTGTWGPPLRLDTKSEIVRLHLEPKT